MQPTKAQIAAQIGNATRELAPDATWRYYSPGDSYECLVWMDDPALQPSKEVTMKKAEELAIAAFAEA